MKFAQYRLVTPVNAYVRGCREFFPTKSPRPCILTYYDLFSPNLT
jgi:hypothetical protein